MILQARTEANELFIAMYETEKPELIKGGLLTGNALNTYYAAQLKQWQSSKREYVVKPQFVDAISALILNHYWDTRHDLDYELGIDCTFLKDRLKLEEVEGFVFTNNGRDGVKEIDTVWALLPLEDKKDMKVILVDSGGHGLEDKKENEAEIWQEAFDIIYDTNILWTKMEEQLKSKFNISRKPTIQEPE